MKTLLAFVALLCLWPVSAHAQTVSATPMDARLTAIERRLVSLQSALPAVEPLSVEQRLAAIEKRLDTLDAQIASLKSAQVVAAAPGSTIPAVSGNQVVGSYTLSNDATGSSCASAGGSCSGSASTGRVGLFRRRR